MDTKLSVVLREGKFFSAFGTVERQGDHNAYVKLGVPFTWDINNGVIVIYDEMSRPWITLWRMNVVNLPEMERKYGLRRGAFVPHSNDGGSFVHSVVLPALEGGVK